MLRARLIVASMLALAACLGLWLPLERRADARRTEEPIVARAGELLKTFEEPLPPGARVRIGSTRFRHPVRMGDDRSSVAPTVMVHTRDGEITLTDRATGVRSQPDELRGRRWTNAIVSPDGARLFTWQRSIFGFEMGLDLEGYVWTIGRSDRGTFQVANPVRLANSGRWRSVELSAFSADSRRLVVADSDSVLTFDAVDGGLLRRHLSALKRIVGLSKHGEHVVWSQVDGSSNENLFFFGSVLRGTISNPMRFRARDEEQRPPFPLEFLPTSRLYRQTISIAITVHDTWTNNEIVQLTVPIFTDVTDRRVGLSPDGRHVWAEFDSRILVWHVDSGRQVLDVGPPSNLGPGDEYRPSAEFENDADLIAVRSGTDSPRVFNLASGELVTDNRAARFGRERAIDPEFGVLRRFEVGTNRELPLPAGYSRAIVDYSPVVDRIAIVDAAGRFDLWTTDGDLVRTFQSSGKPFRAVAFSRDGSQLATCDRDRIVRIWSVAAKRELKRIAVPADHDDLIPDRLTFSPNGQRLLVQHQDVYALFDLSDGRCIWDVAGHRVGSVDRTPETWFTPDGRRFGAESNIWYDAAQGELIVEFDRDEDTELIAALFLRSHEFSASSHKFTIGARDRWRIAAPVAEGIDVLEERDHVLSRLPISGHRRFSPDGRRVLTWQGDRAAVFEVASGELAFELHYPGGAIDDAFLTPDGRSLITSNHREVIVWNLAAEPGAADPWADLIGSTTTAEQARRRLLADPAMAESLLRSRLKQAEPIDVAEVNRLIATLDHDEYRVRERSVVRLRELGRRVKPYLQGVTPKSPEGNERLAVIRRDLEAGLTSTERRQIRAVELLQQLDRPTTRDFLELLAAGDPAAVLTEEARHASAAGR